MHGENPEFSASEALQEEPKVEPAEELVEVKDNVLKFESHDMPAEHVAKHIFENMHPHQKVAEILKGAKFDSLEDAEEALKKMDAAKHALLDTVGTKIKEGKQQLGKKTPDKIVMTLRAKVKDRALNQGKVVKEIIALEKEMQMLARKIRLVKIELNNPSKEEEFKKAA